MREATATRRTAETAISVTWKLDTAGDSRIATGIGFLDHMLEALARHSGTSLQVQCQGDLHIDGHHTTEDIGIVMGRCLRDALGERQGIERYGHICVPLDEALVCASIDISGRGHLSYDLRIPAAMLGSWDTELVGEFFHALSANAQICLHLHQQAGRNSHHIVEAAFKACARALRQAIDISGSGIPSTKGALD